MSYVDAFYEQGKDIVTVVERVDGKRIIKEIQPVHNFYYADPNGKHKSIYGDPVKVCFLKKIRDEKKFDSLEDLKKQLVKDQEICKRIISTL